MAVTFSIVASDMLFLNIYYVYDLRRFYDKYLLIQSFTSVVGNSKRELLLRSQKLRTKRTVYLKLVWNLFILLLGLQQQLTARLACISGTTPTCIWRQRSLSLYVRPMNKCTLWQQLTQLQKQCDMPISHQHEAREFWHISPVSIHHSVYRSADCFSSTRCHTFKLSVIASSNK